MFTQPFDPPPALSFSGKEVARVLALQAPFEQARLGLVRREVFRGANNAFYAFGDVGRLLPGELRPLLHASVKVLEWIAALRLLEKDLGDAQRGPLTSLPHYRKRKARRD